MYRPVCTQLYPHILSVYIVAKHRNKYIPYRDIPRYPGIYIDRKGIYHDIRGITQYIRIGKIRKWPDSNPEPHAYCTAVHTTALPALMNV